MVPTNLFLVCNAHIDIAWLWSWEEGAMEALASFRTAVRFCREYDGFVFNHNEAILYQWIEEYDPELFGEIQVLVAEGKWNIMGGWYLQPDCNMPSGEALVRQILKGRAYFEEKFHVCPKTAINFDSFGNTRGLVQILVKSGYDSYIVCRPGQKDFPLEDNDFIWTGFDGSEILVHRIVNGYSSGKGKIRERICKYLEDNFKVENGLLLWGIGNHGGGPSKEDLEEIEKMKNEGFPLFHTTPEHYFQKVRESGKDLIKIKKSIQHWGVGCYTSSIKVKECHRKLESTYFVTEKMAAHVAALELLPYPREQLEEALHDLLLLEFHDILPGSAIKKVEEEAIRLAHHGLEILARLKLKLFLAMIQGTPHKAEKSGEYLTPIYVYNPHPFFVEDIFEYELALSDTIREGFGYCMLMKDGCELPVQTERVENNVPIQWRKRMAFHMKLKPYSMQRLDFSTVIGNAPEMPKAIEYAGTPLVFENERMKFSINRQTGLVESYEVGGKQYLRPGSFKAEVFQDTHDSWGMTKNKYNISAGSFSICRDNIGNTKLRIIETGEVRSIVEAEFSYGTSFMVIRYKIPRKGTEVEIELLLKFAEELKGIKLAVHTVYEQGHYLGDTAFGVEELNQDEQEVVAQKWVGVRDENTMVNLINDCVYGSSFKNGSFYPTLIKSCGYAAHPMEGRQHMPKDRFIECGEYQSKKYRFYLNAGSVEERLGNIGREAVIKHERPYIMNGFTDINTDASLPFLEVEDSRIICSSVKEAEDRTGFVIRVFNTTAEVVKTTIRSAVYGTEQKLSLEPYEIRTYKYKKAEHQWEETDLLENKIKSSEVL